MIAAFSFDTVLAIRAISLGLGLGAFFLGVFAVLMVLLAMAWAAVVKRWRRWRQARIARSFRREVARYHTARARQHD